MYSPEKMTYFEFDDLTEQLYNKKELKKLSIKTDDNETISGIYIKNQDKQKTIIYAHGNAGNIKNSIKYLNLSKYGSIVIFDYRGFGISTGTPTPDGTVKDIYAIWKYLITNENVAPENIVLYGESIGTGVVIEFGKILTNINKQYCNKIIIQSPFYSVKRKAHEDMGNILGFLAFDYYPTNKNIKYINKNTEIIIIHSKNDEIVNIQHCYDLIEENKDKNINFIEIDGTHNDLEYTKEYYDMLESIENNNK
jgi:fermentation-respiration switch protein FrsA (DUF1100 family)